MINLGRQIVQALLVDPKRVRLADDAAELSGRELLGEIKLKSHKLRQIGLKSGDYLIVTCDRGAEFWVDCIASWIIGAVTICIQKNPENKLVETLLSKVSPVGILNGDMPVPENLSNLRNFSLLPSVVARDDVGSDEDLLTNVAEYPKEAAVLFTSGTTGVPKGVLLTHELLYNNALASASRLRISAQDKLMIATPYRFISSISHFLVTMISGGTFIGIESRLLPSSFIEKISKLKVTAFGGAPLHLRHISNVTSKDLPKLRWVMSSGDRLNPDTAKILLEKFPELEIHNVYGMAELGGRFLTMPPAWLSTYPNSVGFPVPGYEIKVISETGELCSAGEPGNIIATCPWPIMGYLRAEKENKELFCSHGLRTGDVGYVNEEGFVFLTGRSDTVFKRSGFKVASQPIMDAISSLEFVEDAYVCGKPHDTEGHVPYAYIQFAVGYENTSHKMMVSILRTEKKLPSDHIPLKFISVPSIPRTGSGKVDRQRMENIANSHGQLTP